MTSIATPFVLMAPLNGKPGLEIWFDWERGIDGAPNQAPFAWRHEDSLFLQQVFEPEAPVRSVGPLSDEEWAQLEEGAVWVPCGVSGELGRKALEIHAGAPLGIGRSLVRGPGQ